MLNRWESIKWYANDDASAGEAVKMAWDDFKDIARIVDAAKEFQQSMRGEWPADRFDDLTKALEELEK